MARGNWENSEVHTDGSKGIVAQQQRIMQQQSVMQQRLEVAHKDTLSKGGLASNDWAPSIFESPSPPMDYGWHGATLPCHPNVQQQEARQQPHNARLQVQEQHQAQLQQHIAQDQRLQQDQQDQAHEQAERYQRQRLGQAPIDSMDLQHPENRTHSNRVVLPATTARYVKLNLPKLPNNLAYDFGTASTIPQTDHSDKPTKPVDLGSYTQPFLSFISENPTVFHAVASVAERFKSQGFKKLSKRDSWTTRLNRGGKYFFERNGSSLIAFVVGEEYESGDGASVIASHIDALATRLKPISTLSTKAGYVQLGVAPYAGALNNTWWDRDLGIGGRVLVKDSKTGKIETKLVKLGWPIARIPTLAPHFGAAANLSNPNKETEMVPIIGLDSVDSSSGSSDKPRESSVLGGAGTFTATQPERLVKAIAREINIQDYSTIINWELELFDTQPAQLGGLDKEFIFAGRVDDKLCSFAAIEALIASSKNPCSDSSAIKIVGCFDDEEIGSLLRQGAHSNLLPSTLERICEAFSDKGCGANKVSQMYANSFLISADVSHAVNPNFMGAYLENHSPRLNTGVAVQADPNGHTTTDSVSTAFLQRVADKCGAKLQVFQIRNNSRSGGTVGPMLSSAMGMRAIDAGLPQLSMHSIRATIGSLDPGLGVQLFKGFFDHFEEVDAEFR